MNDHYKMLRRLGWKAQEALRAARIKEEFYELQKEGRVRFQLEPDDTPDFSWLDDPSWKHARAKELARAETAGVWGLIVEVLTGHAVWETVGTCWGFIGCDWMDSGYDTDLYEEAIKRARHAAGGDA